MFLWGRLEVKRKIYLVDLYSVCFPKAREGLSIKNYGIWNVALVGNRIEQGVFKGNMDVEPLYEREGGSFINIPPLQSSWY